MNLRPESKSWVDEVVRAVMTSFMMRLESGPGIIEKDFSAYFRWPDGIPLELRGDDDQVIPGPYVIQVTLLASYRMTRPPVAIFVSARPLPALGDTLIPIHDDGDAPEKEQWQSLFDYQSDNGFSLAWGLTDALNDMTYGTFARFIQIAGAST